MFKAILCFKQHFLYFYFLIGRGLSFKIEFCHSIQLSVLRKNVEVANLFE